MRCKCIICQKEFNSEYADRGVRDNCPHCMSMWYDPVDTDKPTNTYERKKLIWDIHNQNIVFKNYKREGYRMGADMSEFAEILHEIDIVVENKKQMQLENLKVRKK